MSTRRKEKQIAESDVESTFLNSDSEDEFFDEDEHVVCESSENGSDDEYSDEDKENRPPKRNKPLFSWNSGNFAPTIHPFDRSASGIADNLLTENCLEKDFFLCFLTHDIVKIIVQATNDYHKQVLEHVTLAPNSRIQHWTDITVNELYLFIAITMLMTRTKKLKISEYWSTNSLIHTPVFSSLMSRNRYMSILSMLHFSSPIAQNKDDKLHKIKPLLDYIRGSFKEKLIPFEKLCIDESLVEFKGRLSFKQYIPSKRHRFGIKLFMLCDCETGYILDFIVYCGKGTRIEGHSDLGVAGNVVTTLLEPYLGKGHSIYVDNWYSSPILFDTLYQQKTNACGTVKKNRKNMPKFKKKLKAGETESYNTATILALKWMDRREVTMLTTMHDDTVTDSGKINRTTKEVLKKPKCVQDYNENMGLVDKTDMMLSKLDSMRKSIKWYKKLAFHFIDLMLLNSHALYLTKTGKKPSLAEFQLALIHQLIQQFHTPQSKSKGGRPCTSTDNPTRLTGRHFPTMVPATEKKRNAARVCVVCSKTKKKEKHRKESRYMCGECNVGLCIVPCFQEYHEHLNF